MGTAWLLAAALTISAGAAGAGAPTAEAMSGAAATPPESAMPQPGPLQYNGDWAVGCDNLSRCEAVALQPESAPADAPLLVQIARSGGAAGVVSLRISGLSRLPDMLLLTADGRELTRLDGRTGDEAVIAGPAALTAARAMAGAVTIEVRSASGPKRDRTTWPVSSAGLADALRFIDGRQGRNGRQSAFVPGGEADAGIPLPPVVPVVRQVPSPDADSAPGLTANEMAAAQRLAICDASLTAENVAELFPLDGDAALLLLPCGAGAYNISSVPLVARGTAGARVLSVARFDFAPGFTGEPGKPPLVVNALWDARRGILSSLAKGRGIGDCGASENYVWDGTMFRLIESRAMQLCRGAWEWIRLWEARPERDGTPAAPAPAPAEVHAAATPPR